jgi:hypothetical protein
VSCLSCLSPVGLTRFGSAPDLVCIFVFRPADSAQDVGDSGAGHQTAYNSSQQELEE